MKKLVAILIYVIIGFALAESDSKILVLYVTILPLNYLFLRLALNKKILVYSFFMLLVFIGMGVDPIFFFLRKNHILLSNIVVRNFDFTLTSFFNAYSFFLVYTLSVMLTISIFYKKRNQGLVTGFISKEMKRIVYQGKYIKNADIYIYATVIVGTILSVWMYVNTIGMIGLKNATQLPYHLNGILYYFRKVVITLILLLLYFKSENKRGPLISLLIYAPIVGVTASSRTIPALLLIPVAVMDYYKGNKLKAITLFAFSIVSYGFITASRVYTLASTSVEVGINDVLQMSSVDYIRSLAPEMLLNMIAEITDRLGGSRMMVLVDQFDLTNFMDLLSFYFGGSINDIVDVPGTIMGINFNPEYAMGTGLQLTGTVGLLTNHSYFNAFVQGAFTGIILMAIDKVCRSIIRLMCSVYVKLSVVFASVYVVYILWTAQLMYVYFYLIVVVGLVFHYHIVSNKRVIYTK